MDVLSFKLLFVMTAVTQVRRICEQSQPYFVRALVRHYACVKRRMATRAAHLDSRVHNFLFDKVTVALQAAGLIRISIEPDGNEKKKDKKEKKSRDTLKFFHTQLSFFLSEESRSLLRLLDPPRSLWYHSKRRPGERKMSAALPAGKRIRSSAEETVTAKREKEISRVARSKEDARNFYDRISGWYDAIEGIWTRKSRDAGLQKLGAAEGEKVLEIGFGTGHSILVLARSVGEAGKVYGIDISPRMLDNTLAKVAGSGHAERVELVLGDAAHLPFEEEFFDGVFMSFVLELFDTPEIAKVLSECRKVLKNGGRICVVSLSRSGGMKPMRGLYEWGHRKFPRLLDCRPIFLQASVENAGFRVLDASVTSIAGIPVEIVLASKNV
jgi:ubiquinone/menaquinone biosynthesis C-methylase UbiE